VDWGGYEAFDPGFAGAPLHEVDRDAAEMHFFGLMEEKQERKRQLAELARHSGGFELDGSDESVEALDRWFRANVEADPDRPERLRPMWYAVAQDIGLWLGDLLIERHPHLEWRLFVWGKTDVSYQRPVVIGFKVPNPKYNADFEWTVDVYGHRLVKGLKAPEGELLATLHLREEEAEGKL
jgi:hypothetical protein